MNMQTIKQDDISDEEYYHYVYSIFDKEEDKIYIGSRSTKDEPENDLGLKYKSSSRDKEFMQKQNEQPDNFEYTVLDKFNTRKDANIFEIKTLNRLKDRMNLLNKRIPASPDFCNFGVKYTEETKQKMSIARKNLNYSHSGERNPMYGKKHKEETKQKMRDFATGKKQSIETINKRITNFNKAIIINGIQYKNKRQACLQSGYTKGQIQKMLENEPDKCYYE